MTPTHSTPAVASRLRLWGSGAVCVVILAAGGCSKRSDAPAPPATPPAAATVPPPAEAKPAYADLFGTWAGHTAQRFDKGEVSVDATVSFKPDGHFAETDTCVLNIGQTRPATIHYVVTQDGTWGFDGTDLVLTVADLHGAGVSAEDKQKIMATPSLHAAINRPPATAVTDHVTEWKSDSFMCNPIGQTVDGPVSPYKLIRLSK